MTAHRYLPGKQSSRKLSLRSLGNNEQTEYPALSLGSVSGCWSKELHVVLSGGRVRFTQAGPGEWAAREVSRLKLQTGSRA